MQKNFLGRCSSKRQAGEAWKCTKAKGLCVPGCPGKGERGSRDSCGPGKGEEKTGRAEELGLPLEQGETPGSRDPWERVQKGLGSR